MVGGGIYLHQREPDDCGRRADGQFQRIDQQGLLRDESVADRDPVGGAQWNGHGADESAGAVSNAIHADLPGLEYKPFGHEFFDVEGAVFYARRAVGEAAGRGLSALPTLE